jgi:hypothetical protein
MTHQTITTRYLQPTNNHGPRVRASVKGTHWVSKGWDHGKTNEGNHLDAALHLAESLGWSGTWQGGSTEEGYTFVRCDTALTFTVAKG